MKTPTKVGLLVCLATVLAGSAFGDNGTFSGYMFGDYYYVAGDHNQNIEDANGFWMRRIHFTYDKMLENGFSTRFRVELSNDGDFTANNKMTPAAKDAYLQYKSGDTKVLFGISPTPTWGTIEKIWGYRAVERTPLDLQKFGSSRDFGLAVKGKLGDSGKVFYHAMVANGSGKKSENNKGKKVMGALGAWLSDNVIIEGYADYENRPDDTSRNTIQGFIAYKTSEFRVGFQVSYQNRQMGSGTEDKNWTIWSVFAAAPVAENTSVFARVDGNSDPNPDADHISYIPMDDSTKATFMVGGVDFVLAKDVHVMPNVELVTYSAVNARDPEPDTDVIPRVTFWYKF